MIDTKNEITEHLSAVVGLVVSGVNRAADMLTLQFGPLRTVTNRKGTMKQVGTWALHVQCGWQIEHAGVVRATQADFSGSDDDINFTTQRISDLLVTPGPVTVENILANEAGGVTLSLSGEIRIVVTPNGIPDEEDWRFFSPGSKDKHFVVEGGMIDPDSLS